MGETRDNEYEDELLDYEEEDAQAPDSVATKTNGETAKKWVVSVVIIYFVSIVTVVKIFCRFIFGVFC